VAVLTFNKPIFNGLGPDFAVFENGFSDDFLELAFVEVSSDGKHFIRFPSVSLIQNQTQTGPFDYGGKAEQLHNLAGKYQLFYGTPFDLEDLKGSSAIDLDSITHVRIVDVVGSISSPFAQKDSKGNIINDPYPTVFGSSGFDLDAVGVIHERLSNDDSQESKSFIYPIPALDFICLKPLNSETNWQICDAFGRMIWSGVLKNEEIRLKYEGQRVGLEGAKFNLEKQKIEQELLQGKPLTESQSKAVAYGIAMQDSSNNMKEIENKGFDPASLKNQSAISMANNPIGNIFVSSEARRYKQAQDQFAEAYLRFKSGANTPEPEIQRNLRNMMPAIGDDKASVAQKQKARDEAGRAMSVASGPGANKIQNLQQSGQPNVQVSPAGQSSQIDPKLLEFMTPEQRKLFGG
jgi:hypothetical protein